MKRNVMQMKIKFILILFILLLSNTLFAQSPVINNMPASGVIGQLNFTSGLSGTTASNLNAPSGIAVDPTTGKLFVVDRYNNRVLRWSSVEKMNIGSSAEAV